MRIILSLIFFVNVLFGAEISMGNIQKYNKYKGLLNNSGGLSKDTKTIKSEIVENNINEDDILGIKSNYKIKENRIVDQNIFKYYNKKKRLSRYGQTFFNNNNKLNSVSIPTSDNYILNYADKLLINTFGSTP